LFILLLLLFESPPLNGRVGKIASSIGSVNYRAIRILAFSCYPHFWIFTARWVEKIANLDCQVAFFCLYEFGN